MKPETKKMKGILRKELGRDEIVRNGRTFIKLTMEESERIESYSNEFYSVRALIHTPVGGENNLYWFAVYCET